MRPRGVWVHLALLVVALASSAYVWTRDPKASAATAMQVTVWNARAADVQRIAFESPTKRVKLEARRDELGRYFLGTAQTTPPANAPPDPHKRDAAEPPRTISFVSATAAEKVADALAPLKALREIGRLDPARATEFGFKDPAPTVVVAVGGTEHRLTVGGATPGATDRYVRDEATGNVYAVHGEFVRDLEAGEGALLERDLHGMQDADVDSVRISAAGKSREVLRRGAPSKRIWADPAAPDKADETVTNWLGKMDRLRPSEYVTDADARRETIARIDYTVRGSKGIFLEVAKAPGAGGKPDYYVRSERTRLWAAVHGPWAEQVEQDLSSVLK